MAGPSPEKLLSAVDCSDDSGFTIITLSGEIIRHAKIHSIDGEGLCVSISSSVPEERERRIIAHKDIKELHPENTPRECLCRSTWVYVRGWLSEGDRVTIITTGNMRLVGRVEKTFQGGLVLRNKPESDSTLTQEWVSRNLIADITISSH